MKKQLSSKKFNNQNTKKDIIKTARKLFSKFSYLGVSMNDIAQKLNITKPALYYHFSSKIEIYEKALKESFETFCIALNKKLQTGPPEKILSQMIKAYLEFGLKEKNLLNSIIIKPSLKNYKIAKQINSLKFRTIAIFQPVVKRVLERQNNSIIRKRINEKARLITSLIINIMDGLLLESYSLNKNLNLEKSAKKILKTLL